jgi:glycosyltransferase involved in cell wall biosynthesis
MRVLTLTNAYPDDRSIADSLRGVFIKSEVEDLREMNVQIDLVVKNTANLLGYVPFAVKSICRILFGKHDLIHAHFVPNSALIPALLKRKPLLVTFLGSDANKFPWQNRINFLLTRFVIHRSDRIISLSDAMKRLLVQRLGASPSAVHVVHCSGVDTALFKPISKMHARKQTGLTSSRHVVLFVGNLVAEKGIPSILTVARQIPDVQFAFIGPGHLSAPLENCLVLKEKRHEEMPLWMSAADLLVLPSELEGTPNVILEALACGTPVIASNVGGCPEAVRDGETGVIIPEGDTHALADAIRMLLRNKDLRRKMGRAGRLDMIRRYEHMKMVKRLVRVYKAILVDK